MVHRVLLVQILIHIVRRVIPTDVRHAILHTTLAVEVVSLKLALTVSIMMELQDV